MRLPNGGDLELLWTWQQNALATVTAVLGIALLVVSIVVAQRLRRSGYHQAREEPYGAVAQPVRARDS